MRNKKRFMALALAAVLTFSQVNVISPVATAGESETELTDSSEAVSSDSSTGEETVEDTAVGETLAGVTTDGKAAEESGSSEDGGEDANVAGDDASGNIGDTNDAGENGGAEVGDVDSDSNTGNGSGDVSDNEEGESGDSSSSESASETPEDTDGSEIGDGDISSGDPNTDSGELSDSDSVLTEDPDNNSDSEETVEEAVDEVYYVYVEYPNDTHQLLVGETVTAVIYLRHNYYSEEDDCWYYETIPASDCEVLIENGNGRRAEVSVAGQADDEDGVLINVTGKRAGDVYVTLYLSVNGEEVAERDLDFSVTADGYYYLVADTMDGIVVPLGEDYDLTEAGWTLYCVSYDENGEVSYNPVDEDDYYLSINQDPDAGEWEDYVFDSIDGLVLRNRKHNDPTYADVTAYDSDGNYLTWAQIRFDGLEYNIDLSVTDDRLNEWGYYWIVYGYDQTITLSLNADESSGDLPEGYTVEWEIGDVTGLIQEVSNDGDSYTIEVSDDNSDYDGYGASVEVTIYYEGNEIAYDWVAFLIVIPYVDYDSLGDRTLVVNENDYIDQDSIGYSLTSYENPWGESGSVRITGMSVAEQYTWDEDGNPVETDETIVYVEWNGESGWDICPQIAGGYAVISYTYEGVDGEEKTEYFTVYVNGDRYYLNYEYLDGTTEMLVGETKYINTSLEYVFTNENGDPESYTIEDYVNQGYTLYYEYNEDLFNVETDGTQLVVTAKEETGGDEIYIAILAEDENGDSYRVAEDWIWVNVSDDYWTLEVTGPENVGIGETISLSDFDCVLTNWYSSEESNYWEEVEIDGSKYRVVLSYYDDNCWNVVEGTEEDDFPQLIRRGEWDTHLNLQAQWYDEEDGEWYYLADYSVMFAWVDYSAELSASYNGIETSNIYANDPVTITLEDSWRNEYLIPEDCDIVWSYEVSAYDEKTDEWYTPEDVNVEITESEDGRSIALSVDTADVYVDVYADVYFDGNLFVGAGIGLWTTDTVTYEVDAYADIEGDIWWISTGESVDIIGTVTEYSSAYPDGYTTEMEITGVEIAVQYVLDEYGNYERVSDDEAESGVQIVTIDGTTVTAVTQGVVALEVYYMDVDGEEACFQYAWLYVHDELYWIEPDDVEDDIVYISLGSEDPSVNVRYTLYHYYQNEDGDFVTEEIEYAYLVIENEGDVYDSYYEDEIITANYDEVNDAILITGKSEGDSRLTVCPVDDEGNIMINAGWWIDVYVREKVDAEITASDGSEAQTEYDVSYGDSFNLDLITDSDSGDGIQYKVIEGTDVVTVDAEGNVTVIGVGTAVIKAYVNDGESYYGVEITIKVSADKADAVISGPTTDTITYGEFEYLYLDHYLSVGDGELSYEVIQGIDVVSLDGSKVIIKTPGTAVITISSAETDLYKAASVEYTLIVKEASVPETPDTETPSTETPSTETETPSTETETPSTETETPSTETETPSTETEEPSTETETPGTETEEPSTETEEPSTETESETEEPATESEPETDSETVPTESETETDTETETETETESVTETESETETKTTSATESETTSTASAASSSETSATSSDGSVATGDESPIEFYVAVMLLAACMLLTGGLYRKVRRS